MTEFELQVMYLGDGVHSCGRWRGWLHIEYLEWRNVLALRWSRNGELKCGLFPVYVGFFTLEGIVFKCWKTRNAKHNDINLIYDANIKYDTSGRVSRLLRKRLKQAAGK